jgi:RimJ/RimL family protein N-acetyltransferase
MGVNAKDHMLRIQRIGKKITDEYPIQRIEAAVECDFKQGHRFMRLIGFTLEAERMKGFSENGGDCALYAKVKPWLRHYH